MSKICLHCYVSGRVQGVFFRHRTHKKAKELGLTGWVRNLSDGRVETMICGELEKVEEMRNWLWEGPPAAEVTDVVIKEKPWEDYSGFQVK